MRVLVSIIAYNEARLLPMCLGHLPRDARVQVIDGAFAEFPHECASSTDGTIEIAERWGAEVVTLDRPWRDQMEKRTRQLVAGEVVFILDADEMLHSPLPELPDDADIGWVTVSSPIYTGPFLNPRVFRVREGWHYAGRHHWIYDADGELVTSHSIPGEKYKHAFLPVVIENARDMRESVRDDEKRAYLDARTEGAYADESGVYPRTP
jgi:glycosyltransferase involved in cell wall biosynthesis